MNATPAINATTPIASWSSNATSATVIMKPLMNPTASNESGPSRRAN